MRRLLVTTLLALTAVSVSVPAVSAKTPKLKIRHVAFEGNSAYTAGRLEGLMLSRPSRFLASSYYYPEIFSDDLDNLILFYRQNGYLDARIADTSAVVDSTGKVVDIAIAIEEGIRTHVEGVTIFGNEHFPDSVLRPYLGLKKGDPLRRPVIENAVAAMLWLYAEHGYLDASVTPQVQISTEAHLAVVDYAVRERQQARIDSVMVTESVRTKRYVITRELSFTKGEIIKYSRLLQSQRRLYLTGLFESAFVRPVAAASGDSTRKDILIEIKERPSSELGMSVGYGTIEKFRGRIELTTKSLAGTARQAGLAIEANFISQKISGSFSEPWTLGTRWKTDLNLFGVLRQEPAYHTQSFGASLTMGRKLTTNTTASIAYRFENTDFTQIDVAAMLNGVDPRIRSLTFSIMHDTRDNLFDPQGGWYALWSNEIAGSFLQGSNTFARVLVSLKHFRPLGHRATVAGSIQGGWMDSFGSSEDIPLNERFYTGGPTTLRGFGYQMAGPLDENSEPLGGKFKLVWNVIEVRSAVYKLLGAAAFLDVGNVWTDIKDFDLSSWRADAGGGLRLNTPIGIVRVDCGVNLDRQGDEPRTRIFLGMGHAF